MNGAKTASVKSVTTDTKILDAKRVETAELLVDGVSISEIVPKWKPREHIYRCVLEEDDDYIIFDDEGNFLDCKLDTLENGIGLFSGTKGVEEFSFSLPSLTNGSNMFANCNLGEKAVESILRTIPEYSEGSHSLTMNMSADAFEKFNEITGNYLMAPGAILYKGWEIASNAVITIPVEEITAAIEEIVGEGKVIVETVPTENKVVVHTDRVDDTQLEAVTALLERVLPQKVEVERYNHHIEVSWRDINKYAECRTVDDMLAVNPDYQNDLTSDGQWLYPLPEMTTAPSMKQSTARVFVCNLPKVSKMYGSYQGCGFEIVEYNVPKVGEIDSVFRRMPNLHTVNGDFSKIVNGMNAMGNNPKLTSFNSSLPTLSVGWGIFYGAQLDKESALRVLLSIPNSPADENKYTGALDIGIHVDHQNDEEVLAAIADAETKGWTLTVQWNGTPTAQAAVTYGLRTPPIYARVSEMERPDGTTERSLEWGHYVTDPTDYKEFANLAEAREYYGLPDENIEEEEMTDV